MATKASSILWTVFAWSIGPIFMITGTISIFNPVYEQYSESYNLLVSLGAIIVGYLIIKKWFKERTRA